MRKIRVDYTSDLHLMMLVKKLNKSERFLTDFVENQLVAQDGSRGDWLVVAGDIAEYNSIIEQFLTVCSRYWEQVFFVLGNHDLWLWSKTQSREYAWASDNKKSDMRARVSHLPNVHFLDNDIVEVEGRRVAGSMNWYRLNTTDWWVSCSNDSRYIKPNRVETNNYRSKLDNFFLSNLTGDIDVLITHVPPVVFEPENMDFGQDQCYAKSVQLSSKANVKHWVVGHQHVNEDIDYNGIQLHNNAWGQVVSR